MSSAKTLLRLQNSLKTYSWGSPHLLSNLLGEKNPESLPFAELWLGTHPAGANLVQVDKKTIISLDKLIKSDAVDLLGPMISKKMKQLPFLFKVLGIGSPLSLQLHPNLTQARQGFDTENHAGIPIHSGTRIFKDPYAKSKIICAISDDFEALVGFRPYDQIINEFHLASFSLLYHELRALENQPNSEGLRNFLIALSQIRGSRLDKLLVEAQDYANVASEPHQRWMGQLIELFSNDITCLAPLYMNFIPLPAGKALYVPANTVHCYLQGLTIELMEVSDNTVQLGLTDNKIHTDTSWNLINFDPTIPELLEATQSGITFDTPIPDFVLSRIEITADNPHFINGNNPPQILFCAKGKARLICASGNTKVTDKTALPMVRGEAFFIPYGSGGYSIEGRGEFFIASTS
jgi:mannose-6-phosphate isomerase